MKRRKSNICDMVELETIYRRMENGVEILERETIRKFKVNVDSNSDRPRPAAPRLVIGDASPETDLFIAKARSEVGGLDTFLRGIVRTPLKAK